MRPSDIDAIATILWDYHHMGHRLEPADCILVLGSHDTRVAERGAELFLEGWAPLLVFSGGLGTLTLGKWTRPEAQIFAEIAVLMGVPEESILLEERSTNTGENVRFTQALLEERGLHPQKFIVVQKPYMERRAYATVKRWWPDREILVTSPQFSFADYPNEEISREDVIHIMVGDLQRIREYPARGFQIPQEIPEEVQRAYQELIRLGYTGHMIGE